MKKSFKLMDLECASCAAKMESAIGKIDGVDSVSVSFMTQKMQIEAQDDRFDAILEQVKKTVKKIEPGVAVIG